MAYNQQFIEACENGDLDTIREIYRLNPTIDISVQYESAEEEEEEEEEEEDRWREGVCV